MVTKPTTQPNATRALDRPGTRKKVEAWILEGLKDSEIARRVGVHRSAIFRFRRRNAAEIAPAVAKVEQETIDFAIANKVNRIRDAQLRRDLLDGVRQARAHGGTGMETGIVARQYKMVGSGENASLVEEYKVDTAFLAEWRANDRQVSEELDQLPRGTSINIDARTQILIREYGGIDLNAL